MAENELNELRRRADEGCPEAQYELGWRFSAGQGVEQNDAEALKWLHKAAEQGHDKSQNVLGAMYATGHGGAPQDDVEAAKWFGMAADQGLAQAQHSLGAMYYYGSGVLQDYTEAVKWFGMAADQGLAQAQHDLGVMYADGRGVQQDYVKAHIWWNLAAAQGNDEACEKRDIVAKMLTPSQVADAQCRAREKMEEMHDE